MHVAMQTFTTTHFVWAVGSDLFSTEAIVTEVRASSWSALQGYHNTLWVPSNLHSHIPLDQGCIDVCAEIQRHVLIDIGSSWVWLPATF